MPRRNDRIGSVAKSAGPTLRHYTNLGMFECVRCGRWMPGRWDMGEQVPSDVLMHIDSHKRPVEALRAREIVLAEASPLPPKIRSLLDMIATAQEGATVVSVLRDGKMTTGVSMKSRHWYDIVALAARIKGGKV